MAIDPTHLDSSAASLTRRSFVGRAAALVAASSPAAALLTGCGAQSGSVKKESGGRQKVTFLTITPLSLSFAAEIMADTGGHFRKEGLDVSIQPTRGSAQAIQLVLSNRALLTRAGAIETIEAIASKDAPLRGVGMLMQGETIRFVSSRRDPLTRPADFKGKTIGIPSKKGTSETTLDLVLRAGHVDPGDVERQVVGLSPGVYELVQRGRLDAYIVGVDVAVTLQKKNVGAVLFDPSTVVTAGQGYMVTERSLDQNRDTLQRYLRAVRAGVDSILADDRLDTTLKSMRTKYHFPTLADDAVAKESIRQVKKAWLAAGRDNVLKTVPERWKKTYDQLVALGEIKGGADPSKWYTNELADRAAA